MRLVAILAALAVGLATPVDAQVLLARPVQVAATLPAGTSRLTDNAYAYRPKQLRDPAPLIVLLHGAGGDASRVLARYVPVAERWGVLAKLVAHGEDVTDQNLPLMYWYALEPMVVADGRRGLALAMTSKIPKLRELATRRLAESSRTTKDTKVSKN